MNSVSADIENLSDRKATSNQWLVDRGLLAGYRVRVV